MDRLIYFCSLFFLFTSCKQEPIENPEPDLTNDILNEFAEDYSQLKVGNYWVYQRFNVDRETGEVTELNLIDSLFVKNEMEVNGEKYFQLKGTWFGLEFSRLLRNEGERLISPTGKVFLSTIDLPDTVSIERSIPNQQIDSIYSVLTNNEEIIEKPFGVYESFFQFDQTLFLNPSMTGGDPVRHETEFYSSGMGVVKYTSFYGSGSTDTEMRLIRTNVSQ